MVGWEAERSHNKTLRYQELGQRAQAGDQVGLESRQQEMPGESLKPEVQWASVQEQVQLAALGTQVAGVGGECRDGQVQSRTEAGLWREPAARMHEGPGEP